MLDFKKFLLLFFIGFELVSASELYISEIMYNPKGNDEGNEWVEVVNLSNNFIKIFGGRNGWRFNDGENHLFENLTLELAPGEVLVIVQNKNKFLTTYPYFNQKLIEVKNMNLKNNGGNISLFDDKKNLITSRIYSKDCGGEENDFTIIFLNDSCYENEVIKGTPGKYPDLPKKEQKSKPEITFSSSSQSTNIQETTTPTSSLITSSSILNNYQNQNQKLEETESDCLVINEFLPNPQGRDENKEFVEIFNECYQEIDLSEILLKIGRYKIKLEGKIKGREYLVISNANKKFFIRNKKETLELVKGNNVFYRISYNGEAPEGFSFSRIEEEWGWTEPTPGKENNSSFVDLISIRKESNTNDNLANILKTENKKDFSNFVEENQISKLSLANNYFSEKINFLLIVFLSLIFILILIFIFVFLFKF